MSVSDTPRATAVRAAELKTSLSEINARIASAVQSSVHPTLNPTLVAVSKYKPASDVASAYEAGQRDFGENYVNEVLDKAPVLPSDIQWHFIGHLQSNKAKALAAVPNLHTLHTLTSTKLATALNKARTSAGSPLNVLLQINTSEEDSKSGLPPLYAVDASPETLETTWSQEGVVTLARHIITSCASLRLTGLMTIGSLENSITSDERNKDFQSLIRTRAVLETVLKREFPLTGQGEVRPKWGNDKGELTLSMGMSSDFEAAIRAGSGIVRVGTGIFGERPKKGHNDPHVPEVVEGKSNITEDST